MTNQDKFINVHIWNNRMQSYLYAGKLVHEAGMVSFQYDKDYIQGKHAHLEPKTLLTSLPNGKYDSPHGHGLLPLYFQQFLPGPYAQRLLGKAIEGYARLNQFEKLLAVTQHTGDYFAIQLNSHLSQPNRPVLDLAVIDEVADVLSGAKSPDTLAKSWYLPLCVQSGLRPKLDFVDASTAERFNVRLPHTTIYPELAMRCAVNELEQLAGIESCTSTIATLPSGNEVALQQVFNNTYQSFKGRKFLIKYNRVPFTCLLNDDAAAASVRPVVFQDAVNIIKQHSAAVDEDLHQLTLRNLFSAAINHTTNGLDDLHFIDVGINQWRLAPATNALPHPMKDTRFAMAFTDLELCGHQITFNEAFAIRLAALADLSANTGTDLFEKVSQALTNSPTVLQQHQLSSKFESLLSARASKTAATPSGPQSTTKPSM